MDLRPILIFSFTSSFFPHLISNIFASAAQMTSPSSQRMRRSFSSHSSSNATLTVACCFLDKESAASGFWCNALKHGPFTHSFLRRSSNRASFRPDLLHRSPGLLQSAESAHAFSR